MQWQVLCVSVEVCSGVHVCVHMCLWKVYVHRSNCVCLHKSVGLGVHVHVCVQKHVVGCIGICMQCV